MTYYTFRKFYRRLSDGKIFSFSELNKVYLDEIESGKTNVNHFLMWINIRTNVTKEFEEIIMDEVKAKELLKECLDILDKVFYTIGGLQYSVIDDPNFNMTKEEYLSLFPDDKYELIPAYDEQRYTRNLLNKEVVTKQ